MKSEKNSTKFLVNVTFSGTVAVEAASEDEALDKVFAQAMEDGVNVIDCWDKDNVDVEIFDQD
jgi:hypothetical protein